MATYSNDVVEDMRAMFRVSVSLFGTGHTAMYVVSLVVNFSVPAGNSDFRQGYMIREQLRQDAEDIPF